MNYTKEILKLDPNMKREEDAFLVARILLAAANHGASQWKIARSLHVTVKKIRPFIENLKKNKVFSGNNVFHSGWFDKKHGAIGFFLDVNIGLGYLERSIQ